MKYCSHCGAEIEDDAVICVSCGCATNDGKAKSSNNNNIGKVALIFMIIGCIGTPLLSMLQCASYLGDPNTAMIGTIAMILCLIPLAWCIPMTIHFGRKQKKGESVGMAFKVCTLLFVNLVAGILMLCMRSDND